MEDERASREPAGRLVPWPLVALIALWGAAIALTAVAALRYSYDSSTRALSLAALVALV